MHFEALSRGTPTLISERSGLAEALREIAPDAAAPFIIDVRDQFEDDIQRWQQAIEGVLLDRDAAFHQTRELRDAIAPTLRWAATAQRFLAGCGRCAGPVGGAHTGCFRRAGAHRDVRRQARRGRGVTGVCAVACSSGVRRSTPAELCCARRFTGVTRPRR